jgi:hypothetical protein
LAHAFLWEYSYKRLKLAQLPGQLGVFLTSHPSSTALVATTHGALARSVSCCDSTAVPLPSQNTACTAEGSGYRQCRRVISSPLLTLVTAPVRAIDARMLFSFPTATE